MKFKRFLVVCLSAPLFVLAGGCGRTVAPRAFHEPEQHLGDGWFGYRAQGLGISLEEAKARDRSLSEEEPAHHIWDQQTHAEAAALWANNCAVCHGPDGDPSVLPPADPPFDPEPKKWTGMGPSMGFFFGGDAMRAGVYARIRDGGDTEVNPGTRMPAFGDTLSREQIWALVFFIEEL